MNEVNSPTTPHRQRHHRSTHVEIRDLPLPQLLTPEEAATYLGVSSYTVRQRLKDGEIPGRKHGARWLIRVVDLAAYVEPNNLARI
jgi:excisionase family DNA binding protein